MEDSAHFSQKEVLLLVQKNIHKKKVIFLPSANWSGLDLRGIQLKNAHLKFANLAGCNLSHADLENTNLRFADLTNCDLSHAKLISADLSEAKCNNTKFDGATGLGLRFKQKWNIPITEEDTKRPSSVYGIEPVEKKKEEEKKEKERRRRI